MLAKMKEIMFFLLPSFTSVSTFLNLPFLFLGSGIWREERAPGERKRSSEKPGGGGKERGKERARGETGRGKLSAGEGKRRKEEGYG